MPGQTIEASQRAVFSSSTLQSISLTCSLVRAAGPLAPYLRVGQHLDVHAAYDRTCLKTDLLGCRRVVPIRHRDPVGGLVQELRNGTNGEANARFQMEPAQLQAAANTPD